MTDIPEFVHEERGEKDRPTAYAKLCGRKEYLFGKATTELRNSKDAKASR